MNVSQHQTCISTEDNLVTKKTQKYYDAMAKLRSPYGTWKCEHCDIIFNTRAQLFKHKKQYHLAGKRIPWNKGKTLSEQYRNKIRQAALKRPNFGKCKDQQKQKQRVQKIRASAKLHNGGYRPGSGRGKAGWYKGYWCDSTWQLAYVVYNLQHNIKFERNNVGFDYEFDGKIYKYYPDFILENNIYVEIKGFLDAKNQAKINSFKYDLIIIDKDKIKIYLDYVSQKYGKNFYLNLYQK